MKAVAFTLLILFDAFMAPALTGTSRLGLLMIAAELYNLVRKEKHGSGTSFEKPDIYEFLPIQWYRF